MCQKRGKEATLYLLEVGSNTTDFASARILASGHRIELHTHRAETVKGMHHTAMAGENTLCSVKPLD